MNRKEKIKYYRKENGELNIELIVRKYFAYIYKVITNSSFNSITNEDIEEIIDDVFFVVWKNSEKLEDEKTLELYISEIARRLLLKKGRGKHFEVDIKEQENLLISNIGIDEIIEEKERRKELYTQVKLLNEIDQKIFMKFYYDGLKIKEIAEQMSLSDFNVKTKLHRIRKKLRKYLEEGGYSNEFRKD